MDYEWDATKADTNFKKHGVSFEEAKTVFNNPLAIIFDDELHSSLAEYREIIIGHSQQNRLLLVSFTERPQAIRIISVRLTTQREREDYENTSF
ncbi:BrnT family toxin [Chamaesiphon sp. VAR_48_metabat_403]|uniref:BrnT family toxin n=1 Tax=Chamaesiphon sp. VAR_48_metabat_403 TaxID=2964700 RepID=UPI00286E85B3|nr:BrnT family toxin [Chamaesiphon sp. VAR_48_metabat_403]